MCGVDPNGNKTSKETDTKKNGKQDLLFYFFLPCSLMNVHTPLCYLLLRRAFQFVNFLLLLFHLVVEFPDTLKQDRDERCVVNIFVAVTAFMHHFRKYCFNFLRLENRSLFLPDYS